MGGKQIAIAVACLVVIGLAVAYTVKKQGGPSGPPKHVLEQEHSYVCAKCGELQKMTTGDFIKLAEGPNTKYRKCPKCGDMGLASAGECQYCHEMIPIAPANAEGSYPCPKCKKDTMAPPDASEAPAPAN